MIKRAFDIIIALISINILIVPCILIFIAVKLTSSGPALYWSLRIGRKNTFFMMPKFRTMCLKTPELASDKLKDPTKYLTPIGSFLRHNSLDELPQFLSVLSGDMSVVGPRPALHNQNSLITKRKEFGIDVLLPGITGWAQINGRDNISLSKKIALDNYYLKHKSILLDFKIIIITISKVLRSKNVIH